MKAIDIEFFESYQSAEKICRQMYGEKGVTSYIEAMENTTAPEKSAVLGWKDDYYTLKHSAYIRTRL